MLKFLLLFGVSLPSSLISYQVAPLPLLLDSVAHCVSFSSSAIPNSCLFHLPSFSLEHTFVIFIYQLLFMFLLNNFFLERIFRSIKCYFCLISLTYSITYFNILIKYLSYFSMTRLWHMSYFAMTRLHVFLKAVTISWSSLYSLWRASCKVVVTEWKNIYWVRSHNKT